jgi:hypothetical protein
MIIIVELLAPHVAPCSNSNRSTHDPSLRAKRLKVKLALIYIAFLILITILFRHAEACCSCKYTYKRETENKVKNLDVNEQKCTFFALKCTRLLKNMPHLQLSKCQVLYKKHLKINAIFGSVNTLIKRVAGLIIPHPVVLCENAIILF